MGTTASGLRYPEPVDPIANGALDIRHLAEDVAAKLNIQSGSRVTALNSGSGSTGTITFPRAFPVVPVLVATAGAITGNTVVNCAVSGLNASSFSVYLRQDGGGTWSGSVSLFWVAMVTA
jgi:hypothetical protein